MGQKHKQVERVVAIINSTTTMDYDWHTDKNAARRAYYWYEEHSGEGGYERMIAWVLGRNGTIIQDERFFIAVAPYDEETMDVVFAYGEMDDMKRFAQYYCETYGYNKLRWTREIAGKHKSNKTYLARDFYGKLRTNK